MHFQEVVKFSEWQQKCFIFVYRDGTTKTRVYRSHGDIKRHFYILEIFRIAIILSLYNVVTNNTTHSSIVCIVALRTKKFEQTLDGRGNATLCLSPQMSEIINVFRLYKLAPHIVILLSILYSSESQSIWMH